MPFGCQLFGTATLKSCTLLTDAEPRILDGFFLVILTHVASSCVHDLGWCQAQVLDLCGSLLPQLFDSTLYTFWCFACGWCFANLFSPLPIYCVPQWSVPTPVFVVWGQSRHPFEPKGPPLVSWALLLQAFGELTNRVLMCHTCLHDRPLTYTVPTVSSNTSFCGLGTVEASVRAKGASTCQVGVPLAGLG